jgi:hypothetical protein
MACSKRSAAWQQYMHAYIISLIRGTRIARCAQVCGCTGPCWWHWSVAEAVRCVAEVLGVYGVSLTMVWCDAARCCVVHAGSNFCTKVPVSAGAAYRMADSRWPLAVCSM